MQKLFDDFKITGLSFDSRFAKSGDAFFAIKGKASSGNKFVNEVVNKGVQVVITDNIDMIDHNIASNKQVKIILVKDVRIALSQAAGILYPLLPQYMVATTGTNGKTSVVSYCRQLYSMLRVNSSSVGTLGVEYSDNINLSAIQGIALDSHSLTTPDPVSLRYILDNLAKNNINYVAFEASSHGLDQQRLHGIKVDVACFTSFSQDHLDYHQNMDNYLLAKLKLFTDNLLPEGIAVLNSEMVELDWIKNYLQKHNIKFMSVGTKGDVRIIRTSQSVYGQEINFIYKGGEYNFSTDIIGSFQASNLLMASMLVHLTGFSFTEIIAKLPKIKAVQGRLERVTNNTSPYHIFIDYAHTPDALEKTLLELKKIQSTTNSHSKRKTMLKVIFGCGGDRDITKRPLMGQIAIKLADQVIVTDDNPRNEQASLIRQQIIQGMNDSTNRFIEIAGRESAIIETINNLQLGDILVIAGKGHENYQIIGDHKFPFSDLEISKQVLKNKNIL